MTGWLDRLRGAALAAVRGYGRHGASQQAAAIAFRVLFSLVPLVALIAAVADLVLSDARRDQLVDWVVETLSGSTGLEESVRRILDTGTGTASAAGAVALVGLLWASSAMMSSVRRAFQEIWESAVPRSYVRGKLVDLLVVLGAGLVVVVGFGLSIALQVVYEVGSDIGEATGVEGAGGWLGTITSTAATLALTCGVFAALYRTIPPAKPGWAAIWPGAVVGAVGFHLATGAYGAYLARFGDLDAVYGSLGAVLGFLLVVWAGAIAILLGAEIVAAWPERDPGR